MGVFMRYTSFFSLLLLQLPVAAMFRQVAPALRRIITRSGKESVARRPISQSSPDCSMLKPAVMKLDEFLSGMVPCLDPEELNAYQQLMHARFRSIMTAVNAPFHFDSRLRHLSQEERHAYREEIVGGIMSKIDDVDVERVFASGSEQKGFYWIHYLLAKLEDYQAYFEAPKEELKGFEAAEYQQQGDIIQRVSASVYLHPLYELCNKLYSEEFRDLSFPEDGNPYAGILFNPNMQFFPISPFIALDGSEKHCKAVAVLDGIHRSQYYTCEDVYADYRGVEPSRVKKPGLYTTLCKAVQRHQPRLVEAILKKPETHIKDDLLLPWIVQSLFLCCPDFRNDFDAPRFKAVRRILQLLHNRGFDFNPIPRDPRDFTFYSLKELFWTRHSISTVNLIMSGETYYNGVNERIQRLKVLKDFGCDIKIALLYALNLGDCFADLGVSDSCATRRDPGLMEYLINAVEVNDIGKLNLLNAIVGESNFTFPSQLYLVALLHKLGAKPSAFTFKKALSADNLCDEKKREIVASLSERLEQSTKNALIGQALAGLTDDKKRSARVVLADL